MQPSPLWVEPHLHANFLPLLVPNCLSLGGEDRSDNPYPRRKLPWEHSNSRGIQSKMLNSRNSGLVHSTLSPAEYKTAVLSAVLSKTLWCLGQVASAYPEGTVNVVATLHLPRAWHQL